MNTFQYLKLLTTSSLLALQFQVQAQSVCNNPDAVKTNRCEGFVPVAVSASFDLVAFHAHKLLKYEAQDQLAISFYNPKKGTARLQAEKIRLDGRKYQMIPKQEVWNQGWQTFKGWPVAEFLLPNNITARQLGVLVDNKNHLYYPAFLHLENTKPSSDVYRVYFETYTTINHLTYTVVNQATGEEIYKNSSDDGEDAQSIFSIKVPMPATAKEGIYVLALTIKWNNGGAYKASYPFYHKSGGPQ